MPVDQGCIFAEGEGDRWFERNAAVLQRFDAERDGPMQLLSLYGLRPQAVLEVGASNGARLAALNQRYGARVVGVEPSARAIADGRQRHPQVKLEQGLAERLPIEGSFDLVIVHFVFHWIDRRRLLQAAAEIDRVITDGGYLIIGDFRPDRPTRVRYRHRPDAEVYTYKQDYAALFTGIGTYRLIAAMTADHQRRNWSADAPDHERIAHWLLRKDLNGGYVEATLPPG